MLAVALVAFGGMVDPEQVDWVGEERIVLSDGGDARPADPADPLAKAVTRTGIGRHAGRAMSAVRLRARAATAVQVPATVALRTAAVAGGQTVVELSPLPFIADVRAALALLRGGAPTWYVSVASPVADDEVLVAGAQLASLVAADEVLLGYLPQDAIELPAAAWMHALADAMPGADGDPWRLLAARGPRRAVACTHTGRPVAAGTRFGIELRRGDGAVMASGELAVADDGDLEAAIAAAPVGAASSVLEPPAEQTVHLQWRGVAAADAVRPVLAHFERGLGAAPGEWLALPLGLPVATFHLIELARWIASSSPGTSLADYHAGCRVEPLVDGADAYQRLYADLVAAQAAELMGWSFLDTRLVFGDDASRFQPLAKALAGQGSQSLRILAADFDQQASSQPDALLMAAVLFLWLIIFGEAIYSMAAKLAQSGWLVPALGFLLIIAELFVHVVDLSGSVATLIRRYSGDAKPLLDDINDGLTGGPVALFTRNPAVLSDNPLTVGLQYPLLGLEPDVAGVGIFHDKYQIVRRTGVLDHEVPDSGNPDDPASLTYVGYVGGMDIKPNRLTTWGHQTADPMHDVHARLRGPINDDVAKTFADYWDYAVHQEPSARVPHGPRERVPSPPDLAAIASPLAPPPRVIPAEEDPHLARLVRTVHKSAPGTTATQLPFAREGDDSAARSVMDAIAAAEDYIYIEDQYFTPPRSYVDLLVAAAARCRRLIVVVPSHTDQAFGAEKRDGIYVRLRAAWGDRFVVGTPERRPQTVAATRLTHAGRVNVVGAVSEGDPQILVVPQARVPGDPPFWVWIAGEQMLVTGVQKGVRTQVDGVDVQAALLDVVRGGALGLPGWGAHSRKHPAGAAATLADVSGIYNHAKVMMVDDLFVSIGSTNVNRRGFYHDGEIGVVAVPQALRGSSSNPARLLRTRLWAEHLGMPPVMGPALLRDPVAASDLFFRSRWAGNRFAPASAGDVRPYVPFDATLLPATAISLLKLIVALPQLAVNVAYERVFNVAFDPTSYLQPEPDRELV